MIRGPILSKDDLLKLGSPPICQEIVVESFFAGYRLGMQGELMFEVDGNTTIEEGLKEL